MPAHRHEHHELIVVLQGCLCARLDEREHRIEAGQTIWYPSGTAHTERADPKAPPRTLFMGLAGVERPANWPVVQPDPYGRLAQIMGWLFQERDTGLRQRPELGAAWAGAVLAEINRHHHARSDRMVEQVRRTIQRRLHQRLTLDDLARSAGLSRYHLIRRYRALTGLTPMQDLRRIRLERARDLLLSTPWPLKVIAPRIGFASVYHLARCFRAHFGIPPGTMRRQG